MKNSILKSAWIAVTFLVFLGPLSATEKSENSLLWKISGKDLKAPSYLFGTIHIICKDKFVMDSRIENALAESQQLALEIDLTDPLIAQKMQALSMNEGMRNGKEDLNPEEAKAINDFLTTHYGVGLDQMGVLKPFVLSSLVLTKSITCADQMMYESYFVELVKKDDKKIFELETVASQIEIFDNIPGKLQLQEIAKSLMDNTITEDFKKMMETYHQEDIEGMYDLVTQDAMFQEYSLLLLDNRNKAWIPKIRELIHAESTFIAVGSAHLTGEMGVINLLREAGYTLEPMLAK